MSQVRPSSTPTLASSSVFDSQVETPGDGPLYVWTVDAMTRVGREEPVRDSAAVSIAAANNEYEPFQVIVSARSGDLVNVTAGISDFHSSTGVIPSTYVTLYREHYVQVITPSLYSPYPADWYPDALIPFQDPYTGADLNGPIYDAVPFTVIDGFNQPLWADIYIPKGTPPDTYTATLTVTANDNLVTTLPVTLTVWGFSLPDRASQRSSFGLDVGALERVYGFNTNEQLEVYFRLLRLYNQSLIAHRLMPYPLSGADHDLDLTTGQVNFDTGPHPGLGMNPAQSLDYYLNQLQVNAMLVSMSTTQPYSDALTSQREQAKRYLGSLGQYFTAHGWGDRLYVYLIDEPGDAAQYQAIRDWGTLIHEANNQYGTSIKFLVTEQPTPDDPAWGNLYGAVDIWATCCDKVWLDMDYRGGARAIEQRLALGEEVWWYPALAQPSDEWLTEHNWPTQLVEDYSPVWLLDYPPLNFRIPSWLNQHYGLTGLLYWQTTHWQESFDVWQEPATFRRENIFGSLDYYNGEGSLLYPGQVSNVGFDGPITSMRLKWLRESMEDYEYIQMLSQWGQREYALSQVHTIARSMSDWDMDSTLLYAARQNMGEHLQEIYASLSYHYLPIAVR